MNQVLIYSIQSEYVLNFLKGRKTDEIRKRDLPQWAKDKLARGEKVVGYGYCTKAEPILCHFNNSYYDTLKDDNTLRVVEKALKLNGLVVFKFEVSGTTKYVDCSGCTNTENGYECENDFMYLLSVDPILRKATCLEADEIEEYGNGADLYAHHLTNITPIEPMGIEEFYRQVCIAPDIYGNCDDYISLTKAPQSFQTVWVKGE